MTTNHPETGKSVTLQSPSPFSKTPSGKAELIHSFCKRREFLAQYGLSLAEISRQTGFDYRRLSRVSSRPWDYSPQNIRAALEALEAIDVRPMLLGREFAMAGVDDIDRAISRFCARGLGRGEDHCDVQDASAYVMTRSIGLSLAEIGSARGTRKQNQHKRVRRAEMKRLSDVRLDQLLDDVGALFAALAVPRERGGAP